MAVRRRHSHLFWSLVASGLFITLNASAAGVPSSGLFPGASTGWNVIERLRDAYDRVKAEPAIRTLLNQPGRALTVARKLTRAGIETTKFQDFYQGLEVVGSVALHHRGLSVSAGGLKEEIVNSLARFNLDVRPSIQAGTAVAIAKSLGGQLELAARPELKILPELDSDSARLVYWVRLKSEDPLDVMTGGIDALIDAHSGELVAEIPHVISLAPIHVYDASGVPDEDVDPVSGAPLRLNLENMEHVVREGAVSTEADETARRAHANSSRVLTYYRDHHQRDSFDDEGSQVVNVVHVGRKFANAFWNSDLKMMAYGDGDGTETGDFTLGVDVAGHEMTHGVVSSTSQLMYFGESGALNEAFADYFGKMIEDRDSWIMARELFLKEERRNKGMRNMADPHSVNVRYRGEDDEVIEKPYPATMSERFVAKDACSRRNDFCWVHVNSTIWSHAEYLIHQEIGEQAAERLLYAVMTQFLSPRAGLRNARDATISACYYLFNKGTCTRVKTALRGVGL